ncbi:MAG TPA: hypothetical protein VG056_16735 [Pirellulales bacterium]|jgi:hypothetical protein|nr:hypothetical protein [Pirellulales bacterium]
MHCVQFEMRLNELLDERSSPDADLELVEHARDCSDCADLLAAHELLLDGVETLESPGAGADFAVRVAAELADARRPRWRSWIWSVPAVAATALIAVGLWRVLNAPSYEDGSTARSVPSNSHPVAAGVAPDVTDRYFQYYGSQAKAMTEEFRGRRIEWVEQLADGLKPVADSMSAALHALRRTLPGGDSGVRSSAEPLPLSRIAVIG